MPNTHPPPDRGDSIPPRIEDDPLLRGAGRYTPNRVPADRVVARFFRSSMAHGIVRALDVAAAREAPGIVAILTAADIAPFVPGGAPILDSIANRDGSTTPVPVRPALASDRVRYVGEPIAVVLGTDENAAADAIDLIQLDIEELPAVVALDGAGPVLHASAPGNVAFDWGSGDHDAVEKAFAAAAIVVELDLVIPRIHGAPLEPASAQAFWDGAAGRWTLVAPTQGVHMVRRELAEFYLKVPPEALRVVTPDVGGAFGIRIHALPEQAALLAAARLVGRPVTWCAERTESVLAEPHSRDNRIRAALALAEDGCILALRAHSRCSLGAFVHPGARSTPTGGLHFGLGGPYRMPALALRVEGIYTNNVPTGPFRGAGQPEGTFVLERLLDVAARRLDIDPAEIRRRNLLRPSDFPHVAPPGQTIDSGDPRALLEQALRPPLPPAGNGLLRGRGIGMYAKINGMGRREAAEISVAEDGVVTARIGSQANGQGHATTFAQLLAERLEVARERIRIVQGDTDEVRSGTGTGASSALGTTGTSVALGAAALIRDARSLAAEALEVAAADIAYAGGAFRVVGTDKTVTLAALAARFGPLSATEEIDVTNSFTFGCHACDVTVDPETGTVRIERYVAVDDLGRIVNAPIAAGQIHGGIGQGIGQGLLEDLRHDPETGQPIGVTLLDYALPRADDVPALDIHFAGVAGTTNPLGVRGAGEAGAMASMAAVVNAVHDAVRAHGVEHIDAPLTPQRVWMALSPSRVNRR